MSAGAPTDSAPWRIASIHPSTDLEPVSGGLELAGGGVVVSSAAPGESAHQGTAGAHGCDAPVAGWCLVQAASPTPSNVTSGQHVIPSNPVGATKLFSLRISAPCLRNFQKFFKHGVESLVHFVSASSAFPS